MVSFRMPEVSVLSSWRVRTRADTAALPFADAGLTEVEYEDYLAGLSLPGLDIALADGIELFDLYLFDYHEMPIYAAAAGLALEWGESNANKKRFESPAAFLASLKKEHLHRIAAFLQRRLVEKFHGRGIGRRPRFAAVATHFPNISLPDCDGTKASELRDETIKALRAALYLAHCLGATRVEVVCGTRVPLPLSHSKDTPLEYREKRLIALRSSLLEILTGKGSIRPPRGDNPPRLVLEIEPGCSHLLNSAEEYSTFQDSLAADSRFAEARQRIGLNADLAHFFLTGFPRPDSSLSPKMDAVLSECTFHAHISDHAGDWSVGGVHASDLVPGSYHSQSDYSPWLDLLCDEDKTKLFSGVIGVEMEACFDLEAVNAARNIVRQWLIDRASETNQRGWHWAGGESYHGAFLTMDIGNSTKHFRDPIVLGRVIAALCDEARKQGGSVLSFTGDGLIVLFEDQLQPDQVAAAAYAYAYMAAKVLMREVSGTGIDARMLTLRCGLHWGECYIPRDGPLQQNGIGLDVVYSARLCAWISDKIEPAARRESKNPRGKAQGETGPAKRFHIGATEDFWKRYKSEHPRLTPLHRAKWSEWGEVPFKGLQPKRVYLDMRPPPPDEE